MLPVLTLTRRRVSTGWRSLCERSEEMLRFSSNAQTLHDDRIALILTSVDK